MKSFNNNNGVQLGLNTFVIWACFRVVRLVDIKTVWCLPGNSEITIG